MKTSDFHDFYDILRSTWYTSLVNWAIELIFKGRAPTNVFYVFAGQIAVFASLLDVLMPLKLRNCAKTWFQLMVWTTKGSKCPKTRRTHLTCAFITCSNVVETLPLTLMEIRQSTKSDKQLQCWENRPKVVRNWFFPRIGTSDLKMLLWSCKCLI